MSETTRASVPDVNALLAEMPSIFLQGWDAFPVSIRKCPYPQETVERAEWLRGYRAKCILIDLLHEINVARAQAGLLDDAEGGA